MNGPTRASTFPQDPAGRKAHPVASGVLDYFPDALVMIAAVSFAGNEQHNPGQPLHWNRSKSTDEADALLRHFLQRGEVDTDGIRHSAKMAWRALALLQKEIESATQKGATRTAATNSGTHVLSEDDYKAELRAIAQAMRDEASVLQRPCGCPADGPCLGHGVQVGQIGSTTFTCPQDGEENCCPGNAKAHRLCIELGKGDLP